MTHSPRSLLSPDVVARASGKISEVRFDPSGGLYWLEQRPANAGRSTIVRLRNGSSPQDVTLPDESATTAVHEYGGGSFAVGDGFVVATVGTSLLVVDPSGQRDYLSLPPGCQLSDLTWDATHLTDELLAVCETFSANRDTSQRSLVSVNVVTGELTQIAAGADFYAQPQRGPHGELAWIEWDHPAMPWDATRLMLCPPTGTLASSAATCVAGGTDISIVNPRFDFDGSLLYASDDSGFWRLMRQKDGAREEVTRQLPAGWECGSPLWQLGRNPHVTLDDGSIVLQATHDGMWALWRVARNSDATHISLPWSVVGSSIATDGKVIYFDVSSHDQPWAVARWSPHEGASLVAQMDAPALPASLLPVPRPISVTPSGPYGIYYAPTSGEGDAPPPLIVRIHGGPTSYASTEYSLATAAWTSRGFAVVDVNYRGSTGYGRTYRQGLVRQWGIVDVEDTVAVVDHLVASQLADSLRVLVSGGSAGGYTVLSCLCRTTRFAGGISRYGVGDLVALARDTHPFEAHYLDSLVGPLPEALDRYHELSPVHHVDQITAPLLLLQGTNDRVVPPSQTTEMASALRERGIPTSVILFEGEGHGFRRDDSRATAITAEIAFAQLVCGYEVEWPGAITLTPALALDTVKPTAST